jgi:hypothetical protein
LEELDEEIAAANDRVEELKSREQSRPLQFGCAVFGAFTFSIFIIVVFMGLGRSYFGGWLFYLCLGSLVLLTILSLRRRVPSALALERIRREREEVASILHRLQSHRELLIQATAADQRTPDLTNHGQ